MTEKNEEDQFLEELTDDVLFLGTNIVQNIAYNYLNEPAPPSGIMRTVFYSIMRLIYDMIPIKCLNLFDYEPLDKFLFFVGPQLVFTSMYTRNNRAIFSDMINLTINFAKDYTVKEGT